MGNIVFSQAAKFLQKRRNTRRWIAVVLCLALVVTSGTFGVLTRHGSALTGAEQILDCAYEGHVHGEECYNEAGELICGYADYCVHEHNESCYDGEDNLVCQLPEIPAHVHDESCYVEEEQLICEMEENEIHQHTDDCYDIELGDIVCGMEEHVHDDSCYELITEGEEIPENGEAAQGGESAGSEEPTQSEEPAGSEAPVQNEEPAGNADAAQSEEPAGSEESTQSTEPAGNEESVQSTEPAESAVPQSETPSEDTDAAQSEAPAESVEASQSEAPAESTEPAGDGINECAENRRLICEKEEHTHGNECYNQNKVLKCGKEEGIHTHNEMCYEMKQVAKCGKLELHTHSEECYTDGVLTCGKLELTEHVHGEECFKKAPVMELSTVVDGVTVTVTAAEEDIIPEGAQVSVTPVVKTDAEALEDETAKAEAEALNEKYDEIQQGLEASMEEDETKELKHFQAYDINFYVENENNEKEEVQLGGDVTVKMEFDGSTLPEEITSDETVQIDSVDLVDIKKTEEGLKPETVQDAVVDTTQDDSVQKAEMTMSGEGSTIAFAWIGEINPETGEYLYEDEDVIIRVTPMAEGILPENAKLQVIPLTASEETGEQYQQVAEKLMEKAEKEEYAIAGFLAYDISFVDEDGNKIEPNGEVKVTMNYKEAKIPAEVNAATYDFANEGEAAESTGTEAELNVKVMHLEESEEGSVQVVDMAEQNKVTALETTEEQKIQNAEFVTGGFSVFTITWTWDPSSPYVYDDDEVRITITAVDVDAIPEETTLSITPIKADNPKTAEQYQEVARKLIEKAVEEEYDIAGFLAYDISLKDKDGVEIEPNGKVKVTMEYKRPVAMVEIDADTYALVSQEIEVPQEESATTHKGVDNSMEAPTEDIEQELETSVTVMHLVEDEAGEVAQVVDIGEVGDIAALETTENLEIQKAEFETDSFSSFVITWTSGISVKINVHYVNANWYEIATPQLKDIKNYTGEINLEDYIIPIEGRTFKKIVLDDNTEISKLKGVYSRGGWFESPTLSIIQHNKGKWNENGTWSASGSGWDDWITSSTNTDKNIYIVYSGDEAGPIEGDFGEPDHKKYIKYNEETGDYTLTLDVTGKRGEATGVDVLLVIDKSGSMGSGWGNYNLLPTLKTTVKNTIVPKILPDATSINKVAAVSFSSNSFISSDISTNWEGYAGKDNITSRYSGTEKLSANGGTNWQLAMQKAEAKLAEVSSDNNQKVVIFMSDGDPGYYYGTNGSETGYGSSYNQEAFNKAVDEVTGSTYLKDAKIYSVYLTSGTQTRMSSFATQLRSKGIDAEAVDGTNMETALDNLVAEIVAPAYKNVVIEDTLSEYVEFVSTDVAAFTVTCKKNGVETTLTYGEDYTLVVDVQTKKVTLSLLKGTNDTEGDELDAEATYSISFKIEPSAKARSEYSEKGYPAYTGTGDDGTDAPNNTTSSGRKGFYSNAEAVVRYQVNDKAKDPARYKKPVVQIDPFEGDDEPLLGDPAHSKKIKKVDDNHYRLSLDVKGEVGNSSEIDVLFIIDESGSMDESVNGTKRSKIVTDAINTFKTTLQATDAVKNGDLIVNAAAVTFSGPTSSGSETGVQSCLYGSNGDASGGTWQSLSDFNVTLSPNGGTNWQAGVRRGAEVLQGRSGNKKYVIFVTDGNPTFRYTTQNGGLKTQGDGSSDSYNLSYNAAVLEWTKSSILASSNTGKYVIDTDNVTKAQDFATAIGATYLKGTDKTSLEKQFEDIAKDILRPAYTNVYIQDTLSDYVEFASNDLNGINLKGYKIDEKGVKTDLVLNTDYTVDFNSDSKVIKVNLLGGGRLEDGVTYRFEYDVVVTEEAYKEYLTNGYGNIVGDLGTDAEGNATSASIAGLRSNSEAIVGYTVNGKSGTKDYLHPVVQTASVNHTVVKEWEGDKEESITVQLKASVQKSDGSKLELTKANYSPLPENMSISLTEGEDESWSYRWDKLPKYYREVIEGRAVFTEITYTVEEILTGEQEEKYEVTVSESEDGFTTTITNSAAKDWQIIKASSSDESLTLSGAAFELVGDNGKTYTGSSVTGGVIEWKDEAGKAVSSKEIESGTYTLQETMAPAGYSKSEEQWTVVISYKGALPEITANSGTSEEVKKELQESSNGIYECVFLNEALYELPSTGGEGIYWYSIGGTLLMMAGALILYRNKNKKVRGCRRA